MGVTLFLVVIVAVTSYFVTTFSFITLCHGLPKYFQSSEWQDKLPNFSDSANVPKNITDKLSSVIIRGPPCKQLFAARVFCLHKCSDECQDHGDVSSLTKLKCTVFKDKRMSQDPKDIDMGCKCFFSKKKGIKKRCDTERYSWYKIEQFFSKTYGGPVTASAPATSAAVTTAAASASSGLTTAAGGVTMAAGGATTAGSAATTAAGGATTAAGGATTAAGGATMAAGSATTAGGAVTTAAGATTAGVAATTAATG